MKRGEVVNRRERLCGYSYLKDRCLNRHASSILEMQSQGWSLSHIGIAKSYGLAYRDLGGNTCASQGMANRRILTKLEMIGRLFGEPVHCVKGVFCLSIPSPPT